MKYEVEFQIKADFETNKKMNEEGFNEELFESVCKVFEEEIFDKQGDGRRFCKLKKVDEKVKKKDYKKGDVK